MIVSEKGLEARRKNALLAGRPKGSLARHTMDKVEAHKWWVATVIKDLPKIYEALAAKAFEGDVMAIKELMDRAFGKPVQAVEHGGQDGQPIVFMPLALIQKHALQIDDSVVQSKPVDVTKDVVSTDNGSIKP